MPSQVSSEGRCRRLDTHCGSRRPSDDRGRDWSDVAIRRGILAAAEAGGGKERHSPAASGVDMTLPAPRFGPSETDAELWPPELKENTFWSF